MAAFRRIYLDTNIFINLKESNNETSSLLAGFFDRMQVQAPALLFTSELTLAELLAKPFAEENDDLIRTYGNWISSSDWLEVGSVSRGVLELAGMLRGEFRHLKLPDAIHLAAAFHGKCSHFLTSDTGFQAKYDLRGGRFGALSADMNIVRPDQQTIQMFISDLQTRDLRP